MQKNWGVILALVLTVSCKEEKKEMPEAIAQIPAEEPVIKKYGFNFEEFNVLKDTIKNGDSFGKLMLQNHVDYPKIVKIAQDYKDTFDVKKIKVGKPYLILKSKDTLEKAQIFIYENDRINYTVVDLRDSVRAYTNKKKVKYIQREVAGVVKNNLSESLDTLGVDFAVTINLSEIYAWTIDFFRLEKGNKFKILYKERYINDTL